MMFMCDILVRFRSEQITLGKEKLSNGIRQSTKLRTISYKDWIFYTEQGKIHQSFCIGLTTEILFLYKLHKKNFTRYILFSKCTVVSWKIVDKQKRAIMAKGFEGFYKYMTKEKYFKKLKLFAFFKNWL